MNFVKRNQSLRYYDKEVSEDYFIIEKNVIFAGTHIILDLWNCSFSNKIAPFKKIIKELGFKYAFGQHSGVIDETKDLLELPRFPINEKYGEIDRFKTLMKTPINGARLSSSFGMRKHPIDGFNKMHKGTDFAAPLGTPIMASGDGIITKSGWCGGGGNCVKIKHNSTYQTVYAHMSKFASGIKKGIRVKQGQVIGFVGSTGKSTGPHLHYEVIVDGKRVNSQTLKLPSGKVL